MDYLAWSKQHLKKIILRDGSKKTSVWCMSGSDKPLIVMVHGIGGDYSGLVPLAAELSDTYRVAIIDLPGHGKSDAIPLPDAASLQRWFAVTLDKLEREIGTSAFICAHSFGCSAVLDEKTLQNKKVVLINPVPTPSEMYSRYARVIMRSASFWAYIYNWHFFIYLRGRALLKLHTHDAKHRVRWVGQASRPTYKQTVFQAGLVNMILDGSAYNHATDGNVALVLCGIADTTAAQRDSLDMESIFGQCKTVFLRGGHLLPVESPQRVAAVILEAMVH